MAKRKSGSVKLALFLAIAIGASAFVAANFGGNLLSASTITDCQSAGVDCTFHYGTWGDWSGMGCTGAVCTTYPSGPGTPGNLIRWSEYISSWTGNGMGQQVIVEGGFQTLDNGVSCFEDGTNTAIILHWMDGSGVWHADQVAFAHEVVDWYTVENRHSSPELDWVVQSPDGKTILTSGDWIEARYSVHCAPVLGVGGGWQDVAWQNSVIISGIGSVTWQKGQYVTGDVAAADYHIPYIANPQNNAPEWSLYITSGAQGGATVYGPVSLTSYDGTIYYTVKDSDFNVNGNQGSNFLEVHLRNAIVEPPGGWMKATTISAAYVQYAPSCTVNGFTPESPKQGETVTLSFTCTAASNATLAQIKYIEVDWGYGTPTVHILAATATSDTYVAGSSGDLRVQVIAWAGPQGTIGSSATLTDINVDHQPSNNNTPPGPIPLWVWAALIGIIALAAAIFIPADFGAVHFKPYMRAVTAVIGVSALAAAYLFSLG